MKTLKIRWKQNIVIIFRTNSSKKILISSDWENSVEDWRLWDSEDGEAVVSRTPNTNQCVFAMLVIISWPRVGSQWVPMSANECAVAFPRIFWSNVYFKNSAVNMAQMHDWAIDCLTAQEPQSLESHRIGAKPFETRNETHSNTFKLYLKFWLKYNPIIALR